MHSQRMGALVCLLLSMLIALCPAALPLHAVAEEENVIYYIEPELPSDVEPYDPEHPEDLYEDQLYAKSAILIEASSGEVIFEKNADATMYPASTTKIMTVLLGIMMGDMNQTVYLSQTAADIGDDSSDMGLDVGESINFKDLLYGTMVRSANEGANLIAETLYGSVPAFAEVMNEAAAMYGCTGTHFANANGLHDPNHYTTARDMAKIAQAALQARETLAKTNDPQMVDIIIDRAVLESMSALAGQYKSKFLTRLVNANIDIANIRSFVRIKRIGKDLRFLKEVLADGGSIAVPRYLELFPKTFDDFFEMLDGTPYGPALSGAYDAIKNHGTLSEFEKLCDNFMVEVLKESRFIPFGIEPVLSYLLAKENEVQAIRIVMASKIAGVDPDKITERLRETYA